MLKVMFDSSICYAHYRTYYHGWCQNTLTLNTYLQSKYEVIYNYLNGVETKQFVTIDDGYSGTESDMANSAVLRYYQ